MHLSETDSKLLTFSWEFTYLFYVESAPSQCYCRENQEVISHNKTLLWTAEPVFRSCLTQRHWAEALSLTFSKYQTFVYTQLAWKTFWLPLGCF